MLSYICAVYQVVIILCLPSIYGQTIQPHNLCSDVTAPAGSSGVVEYLQRESSTSCTLVLTGLANGSYVSIPGVNSTTGQPCPSVIINSQSYCIKGTDYGQSVIIQLVHDYLNFTSTSQTPNFTLHYYNQVATCDVDIELPDELRVDQLTGIVTTTYEPTQLIDLGECLPYIDYLPKPSLGIQFELLNTEGLANYINVVNVNFYKTDLPGSTLLFNSGVKETIGIYYRQTQYESYSFMIRFQVLHCGDIPAVPNAAYTTPATPWLARSKVAYDTTPWLAAAKVTYECVDGWELKSDTNTTIVCTIDENREIAVWSDHSNIHCMEVECKLTAEYQNMTNGEITDKRYYYTQQLQYQCDIGFVRAIEVKCTGNGNWSGLPSCVPSPTTASQTGSNGVAVGIGTAVGVIAVTCVIVGVVCGCKKCGRKPASQDNGDVIAALNLTEPAAEVQSSCEF